MNAFWSYFWPAFAAGLVIGAFAATMGFRRSRLRPALAVGAALAIAAAALWHGPLGGADRFAARIDHIVQKTFAFYEIPQATGHLQRGPLTRQVLLSGQADEFQRSELVRLMEAIPGVSSASWTTTAGVPLIVQGALAALIGVVAGLLLAWFIESRRRVNAQYSW
jgi:H+/Cl- antiporter ClcA